MYLKSNLILTDMSAHILTHKSLKPCLLFSARCGMWWVLSLPSHDPSDMNTGLHSRSSPSWRSDEMDMTLRVHKVKACLAVSVDNNNLCSTFVPLERYQLSNVIWFDMTRAVSFLNILVSCSFQSVTPSLSTLLVGSYTNLSLLFLPLW